MKVFSEVPTSDFEFLDGFVALVVDFDFDWDWFAMEVELWSKPGNNQLKVEDGGIQTQSRNINT